MATQEQMEKKRSKQIVEILTAVHALVTIVNELRTEVAELKTEIAGLKFSTVTSSPPTSRRTKK